MFSHDLFDPAVQSAIDDLRDPIDETTDYDVAKELLETLLKLELGLVRKHPDLRRDLIEVLDSEEEEGFVRRDSTIYKPAISDPTIPDATKGKGTSYDSATSNYAIGAAIYIDDIAKESGRKRSTDYDSADSDFAELRPAKKRQEGELKVPKHIKSESEMIGDLRVSHTFMSFD
jgi:hypothetical protein